MWNASSRKPKTKSPFWPSTRHSSCPQPLVWGSHSLHVWAGYLDVPVGPGSGCRGTARWGHMGEATSALSLLSSRSVLIKNFTNQELAFCRGETNLHKPDTYPEAEGRVCWACSGSLSHFLPLLPPSFALPWDLSATARGAKSCWWLQCHPRALPTTAGGMWGLPGSIPSTWQGLTLPWLPRATVKDELCRCPCPSLCPVHICPVTMACL